MKTILLNKEIKTEVLRYVCNIRIMGYVTGKGERDVLNFDVSPHALQCEKTKAEQYAVGFEWGDDNGVIEEDNVITEKKTMRYNVGATTSIILREYVVYKKGGNL